MTNKLGKIVFGVFIISMLTFSNVMASPIEKLPESEDYDEIYLLKDDILRFVNGGPVSETGTRDAIESDIDFQNAIKEYLDPQFIVDQVTSYEDSIELLNSSIYMWIIPVRVDGFLYEACISKLNDGNGNWRMDMVYVSQEGSYTLSEQLGQSLEKNNIDPDSYEFKLIGGITQLDIQYFSL
ncbi:hypothetical protein GKG47_05980 [Lactonifactor sp. BIOML-A3]|uniref:hypothetical protein n=1 Tax=unclassified Lactonifactor TaxID=2636670 RepID=UPI0012AF031A|nr:MULTISPECIES: hypothetical protein [unclassified Lactonifactor]MSA01006.1 hypothetical protein [Lactonifactor sp. BIOML-A5]MSA07800.1 hypothetical protein [Lactonifactor sp. BIOML-A4]MSA11996.1 hypothetical protein [Lactonifactor sp. BIOML-A3]MSA16436.1 hypothetical protein [Lactonifactor sp. BIOML-A2]MSA37040.1 hypothetical protein [Lactonifactor sp. BIOML-A1]